MKVTEICIERPVLAWMLMAATILFGAVAAHKIGVSQYPDVDSPMISVSAVWSGAAAEVLEHDVVEPLEEALSQVEGIRNIFASASQGRAWVGVEMDLSRDIDLALQDVQGRLARLSRILPRDLESLSVSKSNPEDQPIVWVGVSGPLSPTSLADLVRDQVRAPLQILPGVGEIGMGGYRERSIRIWLDATKLSERRLTVLDVIDGIRREHVERPAGRLETAASEMTLRVLGEALDLRAWRDLIVARPAGAMVRLRDVAVVEDGFEDQRRLARINGQPALGLGIRKQRGANAIGVVAAVRRELAQISKTLPPGVKAGVTFDSSQFIAASVHEMEFEIALAVLLTGLCCWLFLGSWAATMNVVLAIPMSLLGTLGVIFFLGYTLNIFTLLGLGLAVGLVVDDAIMVLENIVRHHEAGASPHEAARRGTEEITFAALAATLSVLAIFAPVIFMRGVVGRLFLQFGVTLSVAVCFSYVEAITLAPARCAQLLQRPQGPRGAVGRRVEAALAALIAAYGAVLRRALRRPGWVVGAGAALFVLSLGVAARLPREFVPTQDQSRLLLRMDAPVGVTLSTMDDMVSQVEKVVAAMPEIARDFTVVGGDGGVHRGFMYLTLVQPSARRLRQAGVADALRQKTSDIAGLHIVVQDLSQSGFGGGGYPVAFSLRGADWQALGQSATAVTRRLQESHLLTDLHDDREAAMPELQLLPRRDVAAARGVSVLDMAATLEAMMGGTYVGKFADGGRRLNVQLRLLAAQRGRPEDLQSIYVRNRDGALVPISSLLDARHAPGLLSMHRSNRERSISFVAGVEQGHAQHAALDAVLAQSAMLPPGQHLVLEGSSATFMDSLTDAAFALLFGVVVAYMVLAAQFNSLRHPITVLTILPLSLSGAFVALWASGQSLNMFSMIGLLLLLGIVKKNAILLVDRAVVEQARGATPRAAMLAAGKVRLRPILMTSAATMMAVVPAVLALGPGAETRGPMGVAILGGLLVSTTLSLVVVPAFYVWTDGARLPWRTALAPARHSA